MRIGSFFIILLVALVALGYLLSDWGHLHRDLSGLQKDMERLNQAIKQAEHEKQNALIGLQSCQQLVDQSNQTIGHLTDENKYLKEQNNRLTIAGPSPSAMESIPQSQVVQSNIFDLIPFIILTFGLTGMLELKILRKQFPLKRHVTKEGRYICLTDVEIKELVQWRRATFNSSIGDTAMITKSVR